ncbi:flagellar biosynthesis anti-sigma factor FlgM [bacterium]|nr:flagellar biosynthesis anti-sigma factor FlgM [bacterium]
MVDIVGINSSANHPNRVGDRGSVAKGSSSQAKETSSTTTNSDRIEISAGARQVGVLSRLVKTAQAEPNVRADAVARAKEKLENGEFEGVEVSRDAAKKILGVS